MLEPKALPKAEVTYLVKTLPCEIQKLRTWIVKNYWSLDNRRYHSPDAILPQSIRL